MRQALLKSLYDLHSWIGVFVGLLLYVVCFSGTVALFAKELAPWDRGGSAHAMPIPLDGMDAALSDAAQKAGDKGRGVFLNIMLPGTYRDDVLIRAGGHVLHYDPATGERVSPRGSVAADILVSLHTDLLLPPEVGRHVVGVLGVVMLISLVTGVVLHRRYIRDAFSFRIDKSMRRIWTDAHKALGLWSLPFQVLMALTGAVLGFIGLVLMPAALLSYGGDSMSAAVAFDMTPPPALGEAAPMMSVTEILAQAQLALPGFEPEQILFAGYGREGAVAQVYGNRLGHLVYYPWVDVSATTGAVLNVVDWSEATIGKRLYAMVTPFHYGSYGGIWLKAGYALLGLSACFLIASGLSIWKTRLDRTVLGQGGRWFMATADGVLYGMPLACVSLVFLGHALPSVMSGDMAMMITLFFAMCGTAVGWCRWRHRQSGGATDLLMVTGVVLVAFPFIGGSTMRGGAEPAVVTVNVVAVAVGFFVLWLALRLRRSVRVKPEPSAP